MGETITLTIIVKNEAANLKDCLESVSEQVDEVVIVDTGSTDGTLDIARAYTDKIYNYPWRGDFSAARNYAITKASGTWILSLDADEELVPASGDLKRLVAESEKTEAYLLPLDNPTADATGEANRFLVLRLFKNNGRYWFQGKIHEQIVICEDSVVGIAEGPVIRHKMLSAKERNRKRGRNLALLKKAAAEDPQNYFLQYYLGVEWLMLGKPDRALPFLRRAYANLTDENLLFRAPALRYLIVCLKALGRYDEAICLCLESDLKYPDYTDIYYLGGVLFEEKKEYRLAVKWLNQALKCGTPPPLYSHMKGAGGFLACYHLGYCHEMLGETESARGCYEQALDANPRYIYPVYNLFLNAKAKYGPRYTLEYFKERGYLREIDLSLAVADLFFTSGYPALARRCLESTEANGANRKRAVEVQFYLGQYNILSGRLKQGLKYLGQVPAESNFYIQACILKVLAFLLLGRFAAGRDQALKLWKIPAARCCALVLLSLARLVEKGEEVNCPPKVGEKDLPEVALALLDQCSRYLPESEQGRQKDLFSRMANNLRAIIKNGQTQGYLALYKYYQGKIDNAQEFLNYKFGYKFDLAGAGNEEKTDRKPVYDCKK